MIRLKTDPMLKNLSSGPKIKDRRLIMKSPSLIPALAYQTVPEIADRTRVGIQGHEPILWNWYRVPGIPGITRSRRHRLRRKNPIGNFGTVCPGPCRRRFMI
jgi:hypothetical protein